MTVVDDFRTLFQGREDAFGTEQGGCFRPTSMMAPFDWADEHLRGIQALGVYPMKVYDPTSPGPLAGAWVCKWGCVDFDVKSDHHKSYDYETEQEAHTAACNLQKVLSALGVTSWIERTRSSGRHVWVFAEGWVACAVMRRSLLVACDVAGVSSREVNPKNESQPDSSVLGNYVRLPCPGALMADNQRYTYRETRCVFGNGTEEGPIPVDLFVLDAMNQRTPRATLEEIAALWVPPKRLEIERGAHRDVDVNQTLYERMLPMAQEQFDETNPDDRSGALSRLAGLLATQLRNPFEPAEVLELLYAADERWGKFRDRRDREQRLLEIVEWAYQ